MLIDNKKMREVQTLLDKIEIEKGERDFKYGRMASLRSEIRNMSFDAKSVERSGDEKRIGAFNTSYVAKLAELSRLMQTTGQSNRDDAVRLVREIKSK